MLRPFVSLVFIAACLAAVVPPARADQPASPLGYEQILERLETNAPVRWLVRMVDYDADHPQLQAERLKTLGGPIEDYTFVADYEELRGHTISTAVRLAGGSVPAGSSVSAILFPIGNHTIFPASVRGMLQVVQQIDIRRAAQPGYQPAPLDELLTATERQNLAAVDLASWAWPNYRDHYRAFAQAFSILRARRASAIQHIGHIGPDWCPPGAARLLHPHSPGETNTVALPLAGGGRVTIENLGVRVFLIRNLPIDELAGSKRIDFDEPAAQYLPELDLP